MNVSTAELQPIADQLVELLGIRINAGQIVLHFNEGKVQKCEVNSVFKATKDLGRPPAPLDR